MTYFSFSSCRSDLVPLLPSPPVSLYLSPGTSGHRLTSLLLSAAANGQTVLVWGAGKAERNDVRAVEHFMWSVENGGMDDMI